MTIGGFYLLEIAPVILFFLSLFGIFSTSNVIKSIVFIMLMQTAVIMFWLGIGHGLRPPIFVYDHLLEYTDDMSDPLPQALMLTAIIIGIAVTAINITMLNTLFRKHKTVSWKALEEASADEYEKEWES